MDLPCKSRHAPRHIHAKSSWISSSQTSLFAGKLIDGSVFDSSYERGSPTTFAPNQVIKGWTEAMQLMVEGDKWEMYVTHARTHTYKASLYARTLRFSSAFPQFSPRTSCS
jgi:hypothetical protein